MFPEDYSNISHTPTGKCAASHQTRVPSLWQHIAVSRSSSQVKIFSSTVAATQGFLLSIHGGRSPILIHSCNCGSDYAPTYETHHMLHVTLTHNMGESVEMLGFYLLHWEYTVDCGFRSSLLLPTHKWSQIYGNTC